MIRKLPNSNILTAVLLASSIVLGVNNTAKAQTVTLFRTSTIVPPTFSKVSDAINAALPGDSLVLSAHTFKENNLVINKDLKLTGTSDTTAMTTIDAELKNRAILINTGRVYIKNIAVKNGKMIDGAGGGICNYGSQILSLSGNSSVSNCTATGIFANGGGIFSSGRLDLIDNTTVSNNSATEEGGGVYANSTFIMSGNAKVSNNKADGSGGGIFSKANGGCSISGFAEIANNEAKVAGGGLFGVGTLRNHVSVKNNKAEYGGGIAAFDDAIFLIDSVKITNNIATNSGAGIWLNNSNLDAKGEFEINSNKITPNVGALNLGGAIYNVNGKINIYGGQIRGNISEKAPIYVSMAKGLSATIVGCNIYNPRVDGTRNFEFTTNRPTGSPTTLYFLYTDSCWWGQEDILPLINSSVGQATSGPSIGITKATVRWVLNGGVPVDPTMNTFKLEGVFYARGDFGSPLTMSNQILRSINGTFTANKGSFSPATSWIDTGNVVSSNYSAPALSDSIEIVAWIDADTFRSGKIAVKGLSIAKQNLGESIKVYPNPATETIYIAEATPGTRVAIYNISGQLLLSKNLSNKLETIDVAALATGNYILQLVDAAGNKMTTQITKH